MSITQKISQTYVHEEKFIGRLYNIFQGYSHINLRFPCIISPKSIYDKTAAKKRWSPSKIVHLDVKSTFHHIFPSGNMQSLPRGDPWNLNSVSSTINPRESFKFNFLCSLCSSLFRDSFVSPFQANTRIRLQTTYSFRNKANLHNAINIYATPRHYSK